MPIVRSPLPRRSLLPGSLINYIILILLFSPSAFGGVRWIMTGGTLSMGTSENGVRGKPDPARVLESVGLKRSGLEAVEIKTLFGSGIDSSQIVLEHLEEIVHTVEKTLQEGHTPLITHGSDTLATTGGILSQVFPDQFMVLTASFRPLGEPDSDAQPNIEAAFLLAQAGLGKSVPRVPYVVLGGRIYLASSIVKLDVEFSAGKRGFQSFRGPVGWIQNGKIKWDSLFLERFDQGRRKDLSDTLIVRRELRAQALQGRLRLGHIELAYVNSHTPTEYLLSILDRFINGQSDGIIFTGHPASHPFLVEVVARSFKGKPIFFESDTPSDPRVFQGRGVPVGMQPSQLWAKLVVLNRNLRSSRGGSLVGKNLAGEICSDCPHHSFGHQRWKDNFYRPRRTLPIESYHRHRSFLVYFQDRELFRAVLKSELDRLISLRQSGRHVELVIEGVGNGHIDLGKGGSGSNLELLSNAIRLGVRIKIVSGCKDATSNSHYEVGDLLRQIGVLFSTEPGRHDLLN